MTSVDSACCVHDCGSEVDTASVGVEAGSSAVVGVASVLSDFVSSVDLDELSVAATGVGWGVDTGGLGAGAGAGLGYKTKRQTLLSQKDNHTCTFSGKEVCLHHLRGLSK